MAVLASRLIQIVFSGDVVGTETYEAADNATSPGMSEVKSLASGANTITVPTMVGFVPTAVTVIPPTGNTATITLKGVTGDTGVGLHATDPSSFSLKSTTASFVLTTSAIIVGCRFVWS